VNHWEPLGTIGNHCEPLGTDSKSTSRWTASALGFAGSGFAVCLFTRFPSLPILPKSLVPSPWSLCRSRSHGSTQLAAGGLTTSGPTGLFPGPWCLSLVPAPWCLVPGAWSLVPGPWSLFPILCTFQRASRRSISALHPFPARSRMRAQTLSQNRIPAGKPLRPREIKISQNPHSPGRNVHIRARKCFLIRPYRAVVHAACSRAACSTMRPAARHQAFGPETEACRALAPHGLIQPVQRAKEGRKGFAQDSGCMRREIKGTGMPSARG